MVKKGSIWLARGASEKDVPMLIATTLRDHGLRDATSWKGVEHGSLLAAEQTPAGRGLQESHEIMSMPPYATCWAAPLGFR